MIDYTTWSDEKLLEWHERAIRLGTAPSKNTPLMLIEREMDRRTS